MAEFTMPAHGEICWRELATQNKEKARDFYAKLLGWNLEKSKLATAVDYDEIVIGGNAVGGIMQMTKDWGDPLPPTHWVTYIAVDNVDETIGKIRENGGSVCVPPFDIPNVGKVAMINDPAGAAFAIITFAKQ